LKKNKTIIVTGSGGFVGSNLVRFLLKENYNVISVDIRNPKIIHKNHLFYKQEIEKFFNKKIKKIYAVIHLAAESRNNFSIKFPSKVINSNINSTLSILETFKKLKQKPILFFSSTKQIEIDKKQNLYSPYSISKLSCEELIKFYSNKYQFKACIFRFSEIFSLENNPSGKALTVFINRFKKNKRIFIHDKKHKFDFLPLKSIMELILFLLKKPPQKNIKYSFKSDKISIITLVKLMKKYMKSRSQIITQKRTNAKKYLHKEINYNVKKLFSFKSNIKKIILNEANKN